MRYSNGKLQWYEKRRRGILNFGLVQRVLAISWLLLLPVCCPSQGQAGAILNGSVRLAAPGNDGVQWSWPFRARLQVRLCSTDRVFHIETDKNGIFRFGDVPQGKYDVVAGGSGFLPRSVDGVEITDREATAVMIDMGKPRSMSTCFRDDMQLCNNTKFYIEYRNPLAGRPALLQGVVKDWSKRKAKTLARAQVNLLRVGDGRQLGSTLSDRSGRFKFALQPGYYELTMSRSGFQDVKVKEFLVPRESATIVTIITLKIGVITLCVDPDMRR